MQCAGDHTQISTSSFKDIKKEQAANEAKIIQLDAACIVRPKKRKYRQLDQRIQRLKDGLRQNAIGVMEYADAASHFLHLQ